MPYSIGMLDSAVSKNSEAFVIKTQKNNYVIDTGYANAHRDLIKLYDQIPMQKSSKDNELDVLIISHGDDDHCRGLNKLTRVLKPKILVFSPLQLLRMRVIEGLLSVLPETCKEQLQKRNTTFSEFFQRTKTEYKLIRVRNQNNDQNRFNENDPTSDGYDYEEIVVEINDENPYLDMMVLIRKDHFDSIRSSLRQKIQELLGEFETFDTGQTRYMEGMLKSFIHDIRKEDLLPEEIISMMANRDFIPIKEAEIVLGNDAEYGRLINLIRTKLFRKIDNAMSLIVRINSSIFTGDAEEKQLESVMSILQSRDMRYSTLKVPHHGSQKNHVAELYRTLRPTVALWKTSSKVHRNNSSDAYQAILKTFGEGIPYCSSLRDEWSSQDSLGYQVTVEEAVYSKFDAALDAWTLSDPIYIDIDVSDCNSNCNKCEKCLEDKFFAAGKVRAEILSR